MLNVLAGVGMGCGALGWAAGRAPPADGVGCCALRHRPVPSPRRSRRGIEHGIGGAFQAGGARARRGAAAILPARGLHGTIAARHVRRAMRPALPLAAALLLGACSSIDTHRSACSQQLGLAPAIAVKDSAETEPDPAVEACAQQRRAAEERQLGQGIALGLGAALVVGAVAALGASSGGSYRRDGYHHRPRGYYRRPYRPGW
jgi:hypothetical protein